MFWIVPRQHVEQNSEQATCESRKFKFYCEILIVLGRKVYFMAEQDFVKISKSSKSEAIAGRIF